MTILMTTRRKKNMVGGSNMSNQNSAGGALSKPFLSPSIWPMRRGGGRGCP